MLRALLIALFVALVPSIAHAQMKIVIDAGHGGTDPGGVGTGMQEKNVVLDVSKRFKALLDARDLTAGFTFVRFHAGNAGNGNYGHGELDVWARRIEAWHGEGRDVYAYFNNDWEGFAVENALTLLGQLGVTVAG